MRCSAWSSRATWVSSIALPLWLAPGAAAHLTVSPARVPAGERAELRFLVPNERAGAVIDRVRLGKPARGAGPFGILEPKPGWDTRATRRTREWVGGRIAAGAEQSFSLRLDVPSRARQLIFLVALHFSRGPSERYTLRIGVDRDSSHIGVLVAVAAGTVVALVLLFALGRWLR